MKLTSSMIYASNIRYIKSGFPGIYKKLQTISQGDGIFRAEKSKSGEITVCYLKKERPLYFHSRVDPVDEARRWITSQLDKNNKHVILYGFGYGYFLKALLEEAPNITVSIFEPSPEIFVNALENQPVERLINRKNVELTLGFSDKVREDFILQAVRKINVETQLLIMPSYRRIFAEEVDRFQKKFLELVKDHRVNLGFHANAEAWWILNSLKNHKKVLNSPNIFTKKKSFQDKPLIIVSAGPSLEKEYDTLKYIREKNMAYIFAVGSAVHAMLANDITPDAFCSYDPFGHSERVFKKLKRDDFPLIFGSSIFHGNLQLFNGPKFYMVLERDTITPFMLETDKSEILNDAPSIAVIVLQLAYKLGCNPIILVGQDFAFPKGQFYAKDIEHKQSVEFSKNKQFAVKCVDGTEVFTTDMFNSMRRSMEFFLGKIKGMIVINTSQEGARIGGTVEKSLNLLYEQELKENTVNHLWYSDTETEVDKASINEKIIRMKNSFDGFKKPYTEVQRAVKQVDSNRYIKLKVESGYKEIKDLFGLIDLNEYYQVVIRPMINAEVAVLQKFLPEIEKETNYQKKAALIVKHFNNVINKIREHISLTEEIIVNLE